METHVSKVSERLAGKHEVIVFTTDPSGKLQKEEVINGVQVRRFKVFAPGYAYYISPDLLKELRRSTFDVVHGHNYHALPLFFSGLTNYGKLIITPHYHRHGSTFFRDILIRCYKPFGSAVMRNADMVVSVSEYEKSLLLEDFHLDRDKITVVPNGIDRAEFQGSKRRITKKHDEQLTILSIARLEKFKGVQLIIQALPLLDEKIHLEVVGRGSYKGELVQLCEHLKVSHRVHFFQGLERSALIEKYLSADLFVLLSKYEGFGIVVAEALASGTPCIVAKKSALTEWVDNKNCFGIDYPVDVEYLSSLIALVIGKKVSAVDLWDWDDVAKRVELIYLT